jgi:hypothetical protein
MLPVLFQKEQTEAHFYDLVMKKNVTSLFEEPSSVVESLKHHYTLWAFRKCIMFETSSPEYCNI